MATNQPSSAPAAAAASTSARAGLALPVLAAALGYAVDLYDIVLFGVVRVASLADLGVTGAEATVWGIRLLNLQMLGMLVGGFFWGWIGDTRGRRTALFASIALYSAANLANAFVQGTLDYAVLRFVAGFGLAGELGAGIALIAELLGPKRRGYAAALVAMAGLAGALAAALTGSLLPWRQAYLLGGGLGVALLSLRWLSRQESPLFARLPAAGLRSLRALLAHGPSRRSFGLLTLLGLPIWACSALFVNLAPEFGRALGMAAPLKVGEVLLWQAGGSTLGMGLFGVLSERLASRRRAVLAALLLLLALLPLLLTRSSPAAWCAVMAGVGLAQGYWAVFVIACAEHFPTAMRATTTTAIPNVVRSVTIPATLLTQALALQFGWVAAGSTVALAALALGFVALAGLRETWGRPLD